MRFIFLSFVVCTFFSAVYASSDVWSVEGFSRKLRFVMPDHPTGGNQQQRRVQNSTVPLPRSAQFEEQQYHPRMSDRRNKQVYIPASTPPPSYYETMCALRGYIFVPGFTPSYQGGVCTTSILNCPRCDTQFSFTLRSIAQPSSMYFGNRGHINLGLLTPEEFFCPNGRCKIKIFIEGQASGTPFNDGRTSRNSH